MGRKVREDFLDEIIDEETARTPEFPAMVDAALERRRVVAELARARDRLHLSQVEVAKRMSTAQSVVSKLEAGGDVKVSTLLRYAEVVGRRLAWTPRGRSHEGRTAMKKRGGGSPTRNGA